jgi:hypothetical protein
MKRTRGFTRTELLLVTAAVILIFVCAAVAFGNYGMPWEPEPKTPVVTANVKGAATKALKKTATQSSGQPDAAPAAASAPATSVTALPVQSSAHAAPPAVHNSVSADTNLRMQLNDPVAGVNPDDPLQHVQQAVAKPLLQPLGVDVTLQLH